MNEVTALLDKAVGGDRQAQDDLYRLTEPELRKLALHWIRRKSAAGLVRTTEVLDQAFVKLMRIPSPGWQHRGAFYQYASRNIFCVLMDFLDPPPNRPLQMEGDPDERPAPDRGLSIRSLATIQQALKYLERDLSQQHRAVVELRFLGECTLDEVAELLSTNRDRVFRMSRVALAYLREKLGPSFPDFGRSPQHPTGG